MRWDPHSKSPLISILSSISSFSLCPTRIVQLHLTTNDEIGGMIDFFVMCHEGQAFYLCGVTEKMEDGLTVEEAAKWLGCGRRTIDNLISQRRIPAYLIGGRYRIDKHQVLKETKLGS